MATKRHLESGTSDSDEPQAKRPSAILPPISIGSISSLEEMDIKMLQFQNKKLWERIEVRRHAEAELNEQLETLKGKLTATESTMSLVYRYWDQLDENIKVILRRLDILESNKVKEDDDEVRRKSFHRLLGDRDFQDIKENVSKRLEFTRNVFVKVVDAILHVQRNNSTLAQKIERSDAVEDHVKKRNKDLEEKNKKLQQLTTELQAMHNKFTLERDSHEEKVESLDERIEELQEAAENARWELKKTRMREDRLTRRLAEALQKLNNRGVSTEVSNTNNSATSQVSSQKQNPEKSPTDDDQIIAESRLQELEKIKTQHQEALKEIEKYKIELKNIPESLIVQSPAYRTLKSQFSVLYNESVQMKQVLDESRTMLQLTRNNHLRRIEQLECDELQSQRKLRNELIQLEDTLAKVRHDYEAIHAELEQNLAANEQAGPVNREMRHLINSLQNHNRQLKGEIQRYKRKMKDLQHELSKAKQNEINRLQAEVKQEKSPSTSEKFPVKKEETELPNSKQTLVGVQQEELTQKLKQNEEEMQELKEKLRTNEDQTKELRLLLDMYKGMSKEQREKVEIMAGEREAKVRCEELESEVTSLKLRVTSLQEDCRKLKDDVAEKQRVVDEMRAKSQRDRMRAERLEEKLRERHIGPDAETLRKMKVLEETIAEQRRNLASTKQEEEALLSEMDVTGQAFEDMQEQNMRLLQQLREKDDANFKLMSERIKANQVQKLLQEEKSVLQDQAVTLHMQVEAQNQVVRLLEEKERGIQSQMSSMEKEVMLRTQAMELHKRKAVEAVQATEDIKRELEKYKEKMMQLQEQVDEKVENLVEQHFKLSRLQEDAGKLRRKLDKHKKTELYSADEILVEEIKEYKTKLRCPCCNVNNKDAVLTKCFHVFCIKCIKTRYETRQRKCPKCNAAFGGNDFHRIYIE